MNTNKLNNSSTFGQKELTDGYYTNDLNSIDQKGMDGSYCYCRLEKRKIINNNCPQLLLYSLNSGY